MLPTPCARDGKGKGHQGGLPDLVETGGTLLPTPTARSYGTNRSCSAGAAVRPSLARLVSSLPPTPTGAERRADASATAATPTRQPASQASDGATTRLLPTPRVSDAFGPGSHGAGGPDLRTAVTLLPTPRGSDGVKGSPAQRGSHGDLTLPAAAVAVDIGQASAEALRFPGGQHASAHPEAITRWGRYGEAIAAWQQNIGRPSPPPTQPGRHGRPVLAPRWVEWLMGLPDGWVTSLGLPRTVALRLLGNGVVPQQAAAALRALLLIQVRDQAGQQ